MAYTKHGYHISGTDTEPRPQYITRCGGPGLCGQCSVEMYKNNMQENPPETLFDIHPEQRPTFEQELTKLINKHGLEEESGTPDFILAHYLMGALANFSGAVSARATWRGESVGFNPGASINI